MNALTIDVEDWFHVANFQDIIGADEWSNCESRISMNILRILKILSEANVKATFFVLGWVAEKMPEIVQLIQSEGHEIATHGYSHKSISRLKPEEFKKEIEKSIDILVKITGEKILGYRAPNYSVNWDTDWVWEILYQYGIVYDSSIFPVKHTRYGFFSAPRFPFFIDIKENGKIIEFPLSTIRILGNNIPVAGGAYLRLYPYWFIRAAIWSLNHNQQPAIIYFHPWELDLYQPRIKTKFTTRFRHYGNLYTTEQKVKKLLQDFHFAPIRDVLCIKRD